MKKEHFLQSEGFKSVAASILSILIGLAVGSIVIIIVGLTSPNLSLSSAWDGIRIVFGGLFSTGRSASGTLTWGFNPTNIGNMLFRAAPLIMTGLSVGMAYKTGLFNIARRVSTLWVRSFRSPSPSAFRPRRCPPRSSGCSLSSAVRLPVRSGRDPRLVQGAAQHQRGAGLHHDELDRGEPRHMAF